MQVDLGMQARMGSDGCSGFRRQTGDCRSVLQAHLTLVMDARPGGCGRLPAGLAAPHSMRRRRSHHLLPITSCPGQARQRCVHVEVLSESCLGLWHLLRLAQCVAVVCRDRLQFLGLNQPSSSRADRRSWALVCRECPRQQRIGLQLARLCLERLFGVSLRLPCGGLQCSQPVSRTS